VRKWIACSITHFLGSGLHAELEEVGDSQRIALSPPVQNVFVAQIGARVMEYSYRH
jgi:hypothetical protein